nr:leucine-rich repeat protein [Prevotella sp. C561]
MGQLAFSGCSSLTSVTIPNSVTTIGSEAFSGYTRKFNIELQSQVLV